ncbi:MAG: hypothetical protein ACK5W9_02760 [Bdellovibrionales bacterium]
MNFRHGFAAISSMLIFAQFSSAQESNAQETHSGVFIEPAITYETGTAKVDYPSPLSSSSGTADGLGIGAKFGFHISEVFFLALDARYS